MPHTSHDRHAGGGDDLGSTDEVKIFKDEGDREDEKISSENLLVEEKSSLIDLTESEEKSNNEGTRLVQSPVFNKIEPHTSNFNMGYLVSPYTYSNGAPGLSMVNKIGLPPFFCHNSDHLTTPPPAHCGITPLQLDPKMSLSRPAIYTFSSSQYPYPMISPEMSQVASWHTPSVYSTSSTTYRGPPYPNSLPINTTLSSDFPFRFSPSLLPSVHTSSHHALNSHSALITTNNKKDYISQESISTNHRFSSISHELKGGRFERQDKIISENLRKAVKSATKALEKSINTVKNLIDAVNDEVEALKKRLSDVEACLSNVTELRNEIDMLKRALLKQENLNVASNICIVGVPYKRMKACKICFEIYVTVSKLIDLK